MFLLTAAAILGVVCIVRLPRLISSPADSTPSPGAPVVALGPADTYFVTQTSLGTPFQIDSSRLAETKGTTQAIRG